MSKQIQTYETHVQSGILLNANESSLNLSEELMQEVIAAVPSVAFNRYPDNDETELLEAYAKAFQLKPSQLLAGNGSDQMLGYMIGTYLGSGKTLYTYNPDFSMYDYYASSYEAKVEKYALNEDGSLNIDDFITEGKKRGADLIMFSNPNNPSGHCLSLAEVVRIVEGFAPLPVLVDEAYIEFASEESAATLVEQYSNLFVTRTLSKAFGLAGLRLGFLISSEANMKKLKPAAVPYALNSLSMKVGAIVLGHSEEILARAAKIAEAREAMYAEMAQMKKMKFNRSSANFIYGKCANKEALLALFNEAGIVIRNYSGSDAFRITVGTEEENASVMAVLKKFEEADV